MAAQAHQSFYAVLDYNIASYCRLLLKWSPAMAKQLKLGQTLAYKNTNTTYFRSHHSLCLIRVLFFLLQHLFDTPYKKPNLFTIPTLRSPPHTDSSDSSPFQS